MALVSIFCPTSHLPSQLCSPRCAAFWMAHLALSVALATMVLAMSSMTVAMATGRRWGVGLGSSEKKMCVKKPRPSEMLNLQRAIIVTHALMRSTAAAAAAAAPKQ